MQLPVEVAIIPPLLTSVLADRALGEVCSGGELSGAVSLWLCWFGSFVVCPTFGPSVHIFLPLCVCEILILLDE